VSERVPVCSAKDVIRVLRRHGFGQVSQKGSHQKWRHPNGRQVIIANLRVFLPVATGATRQHVERESEAAIK